MVNKLENRLALLGVLLTWTVGGAIALVGYRQMASAVRREAAARVENAVRVGQRLLEGELPHLDPDEELLPAAARAWIVPAASAESDGPLAPLVRMARATGKAEGFAVLPAGLSLVVVRPGPGGQSRVVALPLRDANHLPDRIRDVVFGTETSRHGDATVTLFEGDVRIATNVTTADGRRAVGTRASPAVARRVLGAGQSFRDRAFVVDRWRISHYEPVRAADGAVIGMLFAGLDEAPYVAERERAVGLSVLWVLGLTLAVSAGGWVLGGRLARPLARLTSAAAALARGERESIGTSRGDPEEVRALAVAFDRMSDEIHAKTRALEASRARAEKALADYLEVLGFVAHELKSPIGGALSQLELIGSGLVGQAPDGFVRPLAALRRALDYGREISQSFTQLSRAESEGFAVRPRALADFAVDVAALAAGDFASEAESRRMSVGIEGGPAPAWGDPDLLRVVMDNFIGNAVKYGEEGTEVAVALRPAAGGALRVEVTNRGVGIPADRMGELFGKFHRLHDPQLRSRKGTGVGLYLVKKIVEMHGGTVGVEGEYGRWVRFFFEIPAGPAASATADTPGTLPTGGP
jgi:signal transduction histidine kinase